MITGIINEGAILQRARTGDAAAGEVLFVKYLVESRAVLGLLRRALANAEDRKEMLHEIYMQLISGQNEFRGDARLSTYIYRVARVTILQKYRRENAGKRRMIGRSLLDARDLPGGDESSPDSVYRSQEKRRRILQLIEKLPEAYREVYRLRILQELSYDEIAGRMHLPINTVSTRIHKGKKLLLLHAEAERMQEWL